MAECDFCCTVSLTIHQQVSESSIQIISLLSKPSFHPSSKQPINPFTQQFFQSGRHSNHQGFQFVLIKSLSYISVSQWISKTSSEAVRNSAKSFSHEAIITPFPKVGGLKHEGHERRNHILSYSPGPSKLGLQISYFHHRFICRSCC